MDYIIETENLTKRYGTATVVDKVNLHVPKGKIYGLLGRNGAGKTTAMKMMLQLAFPTEGTVRLFGTNYKENIHTLYSKVGSIIETPGFYSNLTGYENLQILAKLRGGVSKSGVEKALEVVGLHKEKRKVFSDYSLGMMSPMFAYLLVEPPITRMQRSSFAPVLSATLSLVSCCTIPVTSLPYFAFSMISTSLHLLSLDSGLVSITFTVSPTWHSLFSS